MRHRWSSVWNDVHSGRPAGQPRGFLQPETAIRSAEPGLETTNGSSMNHLAFPARFLKNSSPIFTALALGSALVLVLTPTPALAKKESAHALFKAGESAEAKENYDLAYEDFRKAYEKSPNDLRYRAAFYRLRTTASTDHVTRGRKMLAQGDETGALGEFMRAAEIDSGNEAAVQQIAYIRAHQPAPVVRNETSLPPAAADAMEDAAAPAVLKPMSTEPFSLKYTEDAKVVYQAIGKAAGINVLFDPDYNSKRISVDLNNVTLLDALRIVGTLSTTFWRPVTENTIFVAQNSRAKRTELDEQAVQTFYLSNAWQQNDLNDVQTALRNVLPNSKVYGVPSQNAIVMRATPDELMLAQKVINDLDKARPEVVVDIAVMEVNRDKLRNIGLSWPGTVSFALQPPQTSTSTTTTTTGTTSTTGNLTLDNLANLNANSFAVTIGAATANLLMSDSDTKILQNPRIRATDQQKATMKIGSRIPVATGSYQTGAATAITSSLVNTQFQYIDVGVKIEMTPTVHFDHDVTLKLNIEVSSESGSSTISGVTEPIIAQNTTEGVVRLREGEATILSGILNKQDLVSLSGIPGLGELPILKYLFGSKSREVIDDELVFVLVPHVVREQSITPLNLRAIDTGSGQAIELRHISTVTGGGAQAAPGGQAGARPPAGAALRPMNPMNGVNRPGSVPGMGNAGPVNGQTAAAAAPAAMAQLRQAANGMPAGTMAPPPAPTVAAPTIAAPTIAAPSVQAPVSLTLTPPTATQAVGSTFPIAVQLSGATDIAAVPIQIQYDTSKLTLINVAKGDLLTRDGQDAPPVHRDDNGQVNIVASRPPGAPGVNGSGSVCVLTFQARQAGESDIVISRPGALDSSQHPVTASAQGAHITVR
jgi:general secretion pathway protein D